MPQRMAQRADTAANWTSNNPTLAVGEIGFETNTSKFKIGDGSTAWNSLSYHTHLAATVTTDTTNFNNKLSGSDTTVQAALDTLDNLALVDADVLPVKATINNQTGTTYTLQSSDNAKLVTCSNGSAITVTLPNSLSIGFQCALTQLGAGQVAFSGASGATIRNRQSHTKIAGQYGTVSLFVITNSGGASAEYILLGDTAA